MIKAPIIIEGAIEGGEMEKLNNLKFITTVIEHKPCSTWLKKIINTGEALLEVFHPVLRLHTTHLFLSSLSYNSYYIGSGDWEMQSYKLFQLVQGCASTAEA